MIAVRVQLDLFGRFSKYFHKMHFLKQGDSQDFKESEEAAVQIELFLDLRHRHLYVYGDGDPALDYDDVDAGAVIALDQQMRFDPFENDLELPTVLVQVSDGQ